MSGWYDNRPYPLENPKWNGLRTRRSGSAC